MAEQKKVPQTDLDLSQTHLVETSGTTGSPTVPMTDSVGGQPNCIGRYRIEGVLGNGSFGVVYIGYDGQLDRRVAIKVPHSTLIAKPSDVADYIDEARMVASLDHPHIVPVYDVGSDREFPCYVISKFVQGTNLARRLHQQRFSIEEATRLTATICGAIHYAHLRGLVHRDIKPANILMDADNVPYVVDFGLALRQQDVGKGATFAGTPKFMSPEQARSEGHQVDGRSDIFSLGVVFYLLLTGDVPFQHDSRTELLQMIQHAQPQSPQSLNPLVPIELERICLKAMSKLASDRYATAQSMADDLNAYLSMLQRPAEIKRAAIVDRERRQVTVMSCGFVLSSVLSDDPEESDDSLDRFRKSAIKIIESHEGYATQRGDVLVGYFGYPQAHEDDADRAIRAARRISQAMTGQVGIGIATGLVVVGDPNGDRDQMVVGKTPPLADRLQESAEPGEIIVSSETQQLINKRFECSSLGNKILRGFAEPVPVARVENEKAVRSRFDAVRLSGIAPLVGRTIELAAIRDHWQSATHGEGKFVMLRGEAGIGKSRLVHAAGELAGAHPQATAIEMQCSAYYSQSALHPLINWLEDQVQKESGSQDRWEQLQSFALQNAMDEAQSISLIADLLGIPTPPGYAPLGLALEQKGRLTQQCLLSLILRMASSNPLLLVIEDLHWIDPSTLEWLGLLSEQLQGSHLLVLVTTRPDSEHDRITNGWKNVTELSLKNLDTSEAAALVRQISKSSVMSAELCETVVARADGVPLFLEELAKAMIETGSVNSNGISAMEMPLTLRDLLMARLDRLSLGKPVAQIASVLGRQPDAALLSAVWNDRPENLAKGISELVEAELLFAIDSVSGAPTGYRFKHALVQDTAYDSMLKSRRVTEHARIAQLIERDFRSIATSQPTLLAQHFETGAKPDSAAAYWLQAGLQSQSRNAPTEAVSHFQRGLAQLEQVDPSAQRDEAELALQVALGPALIATQGYGSQEVGVACERARKLCESMGTTPQKFPALFVLWAFHCVRANHTTAMPMAEEILGMAQAAGVSDLILEGNLAASCTNFFLGNFPQSLQHLNVCTSMYDPSLHGGHAYQFGQDPAVVAFDYSCWAYWLLGEPQKAQRCIQRALTLAQTLNHPFTLAYTSFYAAWYHFLRKEYDLALAMADQTRQIAAEHHNPVFVANGSVIHAWAKCASGNPSEGVPEMISALELFRSTGSRCFLPTWYAGLSLAQAELGQLDEADQSLAVALDQMESSDERWGEAELQRSKAILLEKRGGDPSDIERWYRQSLSTANRQATIAWRLSTAVSFARWLTKFNRHSDSQEVLRQSLVGIPSDFDNLDATTVRQLLAATEDHHASAE